MSKAFLSMFLTLPLLLISEVNSSWTWLDFMRGVSSPAFQSSWELLPRDEQSRISNLLRYSNLNCEFLWGNWI